MNPTCLQMSATSALTPALSPGERGDESVSLENSLVEFAVGAFLPFDPAGARQPSASALPEHGECFSLSLGERAGVRASAKTFFGFLLTAALCFFASVAARAQTYSIDWFTIDGGGGTSTGGVYSVSGTIGQPDAGPTLSGGNYTVDGGFWGLIAAVQTPGAPLLSITRSNSIVIVFWPFPSTGFVLQENPVINTTNWTDVRTSPTTNGLNLQVVVPSPLGNRFYRLRHP